MSDEETYARIKAIHAKLAARGLTPRGDEIDVYEHEDGTCTIARMDQSHPRWKQ